MHRPLSPPIALLLLCLLLRSSATFCLISSISRVDYIYSPLIYINLYQSIVKECFCVVNMNKKQN